MTSGILHIRTDDGRGIAVAMHDIQSFRVGARVTISIHGKESTGVVTLTEERNIHEINNKERYT